MITPDYEHPAQSNFYSVTAKTPRFFEKDDWQLGGSCGHAHVLPMIWDTQEALEEKCFEPGNEEHHPTSFHLDRNHVFNDVYFGHMWEIDTGMDGVTLYLVALFPDGYEGFSNLTPFKLRLEKSDSGFVFTLAKSDDTPDDFKPELVGFRAHY
jgi:hypothetical protein